MFQIMIVKVPRGEAPEEIRKAWVGLVLPCSGASFSASGVLSGKIVEDEGGFRVPQQAACEILAKTQPSAAQWWKEHGYPKPGRAFVFYEDEVMVLEQNENQNAWG